MATDTRHALGDVAMLGSQTRYAITGTLRTPRSLVFTTAIPILLLVLLSTLFQNAAKLIGIAHAATYYTPAIISLQMMLAGFGMLNTTIVNDREAGLLKRFRGTPMPSWVYLGAVILLTIALVLFTVIVLLLVGLVFYHVHVGADTVAGLAVYTVIGTTTMCSLALAASRICPTADSAAVFSQFSTVVLPFLSGVYLPVALMPAWVVSLGRALPLYPLNAGLQAAFSAAGTTGVTPARVGELLAWGAAGIVLAVRTFRWEPISHR